MKLIHRLEHELILVYLLHIHIGKGNGRRLSLLKSRSIKCRSSAGFATAGGQLHLSQGRAGVWGWSYVAGTARSARWRTVIGTTRLYISVLSGSACATWSLTSSLTLLLSTPAAGESESNHLLPLHSRSALGGGVVCKLFHLTAPVPRLSRVLE